MQDLSPIILSYLEPSPMEMYKSMDSVRQFLTYAECFEDAKNIVQKYENLLAKRQMLQCIPITYEYKNTRLFQLINESDNIMICGEFAVRAYLGIPQTNRIDLFVKTPHGFKDLSIFNDMERDSISFIWEDGKTRIFVHYGNTQMLLFTDIYIQNDLLYISRERIESLKTRQLILHERRTYCVVNRYLDFFDDIIDSIDYDKSYTCACMGFTPGIHSYVNTTSIVKYIDMYTDTFIRELSLLESYAEIRFVPTFKLKYYKIDVPQFDKFYTKDSRFQEVINILNLHFVLQKEGYFYFRYFGLPREIFVDGREYTFMYSKFLSALFIFD